MLPNKFFVSVAIAAALGATAPASAAAQSALTNPPGNQTITQPAGSSLVIQGNLAPQSVDFVLHAAQFPGEDIGVQATNAFNSIPCPSNGPQSVEVVFPANAQLVSTHTIAPQPCDGSGQRNPLRILNMNGAVLQYNGSGDAFLLAQGSASRGLWMPLKVENGQVIGSPAGASGFHLQNGIGATFSSVAVWGFSKGCGTLFEDLNRGWTESTIIENATYGGNAHQICYTNSATNPGTGSFLYNTIRSTLFDMTDGQDGILVNGKSAQLWGGNFDLKFNITSAAKNPATVIRVAEGGSVSRDFITIRGERTGGDPALQNCVFRQSDAASGYNTQAIILQAGIIENCGFQGTNSQSHNLNMQPDLTWQPEAYLAQFRATKWANHTSNNQGYMQIFGAAPGSEHDGGLQLTSRATPGRGNQEADTVTATSDAPIKNVIDCEAASGGACGFGPGWSDTTGTGYNISNLTCAGNVGTVTLASGALAADYKDTVALLSGGTTARQPGIPLNGITLSFLSGAAGSRSATVKGGNCVARTGGVIYLVQYPSAAVDTTSLRVGAAPATAQATVYTQLATFVTGNLAPRAIPPASCADVSEKVSSANGAATTQSDLPFNVIAPGPLGNGPVAVSSPYRPAAGQVTLRFCNNAATNSWTPPAGVYALVSIH